MNTQINAITLGAKDVDRARKFYGESLRCPIQKDEGEFVALSLGAGSSTLALYDWDALAADAGVAPTGIGFRRFTLSYIVDSADKVDEVMAAAARAGGEITKPARRAMWGGYSGYFTDPDGYHWKVASPSGRPLISRKRAPAQPEGEGAARIDPKETAVTIGVNDIKRTKAFYGEGLGCPVDKSYSKFVSFKLGDDSSTFALYTRDDLAADAGVAPPGSGFSGFTLSYIVDSAERVDEVLSAAVHAGGEIARPGEHASWGGYSGYFADPDGFLWKVAAPG
jgi:catechol 2,3-dioxygenase-like lactoylglutathione lyase family enzyme